MAGLQRFLPRRGLTRLSAVSAIDGRYGAVTAPLTDYFSEAALYKMRTKVELEWLKALSRCEGVPEVASLSADALKVCDDILSGWCSTSAERIKSIEKTTNHDVKAVEYFLKECFAASGNRQLSQIAEFLHFGCTSEDINNLSYACLTADAMKNVMLPTMEKLNNAVAEQAVAMADVPMLSRTHGQPATPSTIGKEFANFAFRLAKQQKQAENVRILGKFSGAVGNFAAHQVAYPSVDWESLSRSFVEGALRLEYNAYCTQIEPHDWMAELFHAMSRYNTVLLSFDRDVWSYISLGYFKQRVVAGEIGSSTMPHKVNPIDFENSEGNLGLANAVFGHMAEKLPISRFQRDLSDSTVLRSIGSAFGHSTIAYASTMKGIGKLQVNKAAIQADLDSHAEVLAEAIQTVMRRYGAEAPYERLKELTRGQGAFTVEKLHAFVDSIASSGTIPKEAAASLRSLTPANYIGDSARLARAVPAAMAALR